MEFNPNSPTLMTLHEHWHTVAAILLHKLAESHVVITSADVRSMPPDSAVVVQECADGLHLRLVDAPTAFRLAREHGGLPQ